MAIVRFDSLGDFARACKARVTPSNVFYAAGRFPLDWYNGLTMDHAINTALSGDDSAVIKSMAMLDKLEASLETFIAEWANSPVGAYPIVPEYLSGQPDCMRRRIDVSSDIAPVTVYLPVNANASINPGQVLTRGIAILALVLKLQALRPVKLCITVELSRKGYGAMCGSSDEFIAIDINTQPMDLATVCFALTNIGFVRRLGFSLARELFGYDGQWPKNFNHNNASWHELVRQYFDMGPQDLYIPRATSWETAAFTDPINWVNQQVAKACNGDL